MNEYFISHFETEAPQCDAPALREKKPPGDFGVNLRRLRWERDLSIRQLSRITGISPSGIERDETGAVKRVTIKHLYRLCQFFGVTADELLGFTKMRRSDNAGK